MINWNLVPSRLIQILLLEFRSWITPGCGFVYAIRKWVAVILNHRKIKFLGNDFHYEDRLNPFTLFTYVNEIEHVLKISKLQHENVRVLEVGANVGGWGCALINRLPTAKLYSFEPNPEPFNMLKKNNFSSRWKIFNFGIGAEQGLLDFYYVPNKSGQGSIYRDNADLHLVGGGIVSHCQVKIQPLTTDFLNAMCEGVFFDFVKVDVEGMEQEVIKGLKNTIWSSMYVELSTNRTGRTSVESFMELVHRYWPSAQITYFKDQGGDCADLFLSCTEQQPQNFQR